MRKLKNSATRLRDILTWIPGSDHGLLPELAPAIVPYAEGSVSDIRSPECQPGS